MAHPLACIGTKPGEECRQVLRIDLGTMSDRRGPLHRGSDVVAGIASAFLLGDRKAEYLAAMVLGAMRHLDRAALLDWWIAASSIGGSIASTATLPSW